MNSALGSASIEAPLGVEVRLAAVGPLRGGARTVLSDDELARARRFLSDGARRRFVAGRVLLRELLAELLGVRPADLRFEVALGGKPQLAKPWRGAFEFSVSHSADLAAAAASRGTAIGIDVEALRPIRRAHAVAERYFEPDAADQVKCLAGPERDAAFLQHWTRLEATAKATGRGMAAILEGAREGSARSALDVSQLRMPEGYVGALAAIPLRLAAPSEPGGLAYGSGS
jgi:phosphopantetheinyl transferase